MKQGKKLTRDQKVLVSSAGLEESEWLCHFEDFLYLHLVKKDSNPAEIKIINKNKKKVLAPSKANQDLNITK